MKPFWINTSDQRRLAIAPRPRGNHWLEEDLRRMRQAGVDVLVSMLEQDEARELGLEREATECARAGITFRSVPILDRGVPSSIAAFRSDIDALRSDLHSGKSIAVHCRACIGRSSLLLASLLCTEGCAADEAFALISEARGLQVPDTADQIRWVERFAASLRIDSRSG